MAGLGVEHDVPVGSTHRDSATGTTFFCERLGHDDATVVGVRPRDVADETV